MEELDKLHARALELSNSYDGDMKEWLVKNKHEMLIIIEKISKLEKDIKDNKKLNIHKEKYNHERAN